MKVKVEDLKVSHQIVGIYTSSGEVLHVGDLIDNSAVTYELHSKGITIVRRFPRMEMALRFDDSVEVHDVRSF